MSLRDQRRRQQREIDKFNGDVPVADRDCEDKGNDRERVEDGVTWVRGESGERVIVAMEDVEGDVDIVDADVDVPKSDVTGGGKVIASSRSRSFPFHVRVEIGGGGGCRRL